MKYFGGKHRLRRQIASVINLTINRQTGRQTVFVSLFCGACNVESEVIADRRILNDKNKYLISMWKELRNGFVLPEKVSKEDYYYIKAHQDENPPLTGYVSHQCSFFGKTWGGYVGEIYAKAGIKNTMEISKKLTGCEFLCGDYRDVEIPEGAVVYCDPPYKDTVNAYGVVSFDHSAFWDYMRELSKNHVVIISEQTAPDDFVPIWANKFTRGVRKENHITSGNQGKALKIVEKLFVYSKYKNILADE